VAAAAVNDATNRAAAAGQGSVADAARAANEGGQGMGVLRVEVLSFFGQGAQEEGEEL
jgi:phosphoenolpyruvate-protein kinase (PTS system EI component)